MLLCILQVKKHSASIQPAIERYSKFGIPAQGAAGNARNYCWPAKRVAPARRNPVLARTTLHSRLAAGSPVLSMSKGAYGANQGH